MHLNYANLLSVFETFYIHSSFEAFALNLSLLKTFQSPELSNGGLLHSGLSSNAYVQWQLSTRFKFTPRHHNILLSSQSLHCLKSWSLSFLFYSLCLHSKAVFKWYKAVFVFLWLIHLARCSWSPSMLSLNRFFKKSVCQVWIPYWCTFSMYENVRLLYWRNKSAPPQNTIYFIDWKACKLMLTIYIILLNRKILCYVYYVWWIG